MVKKGLKKKPGPKVNPALKLERQEKIIEGMLQGKSRREIAHDLDVCKSTVHNYWQEMAQERKSDNEEMYDGYVLAELLRYNEMEKDIKEGMDPHDPRTVEIKLKVSKERKLLLALNKPVKTEVKLDILDINVGIPDDLKDI